MLPRTLLALLLLSSNYLSAQRKISTPVTVRLTTQGGILFKPATDAKQYGLSASDATLVKQLENRNGLLVYTPDVAKGKEHSQLTFELLPTHTLDVQLAKGEAQFQEIDNAVAGSIGTGNLIVKGGKANVSLQLQSGDVTVQQSQWQGTVLTRKGNILLEDSPLLTGNAPNGTVTHRYTEAGLKDKKQLIQQFEKGHIEVIGAAQLTDLQLSEGQIVVEGKTEEAYIAIRDKGDITIKQAGKRVEAHTKKGAISVSAPLEFDYMHLTCEGGSITLDLPISFKGTVKILSEVMGKEKPEVKLSHFWQKEAPVFEPVETEEKGKTMSGYFRYRFEKKIGESNSLLLIQLKNADLQINPL